MGACGKGKGKEIMNILEVQNLEKRFGGLIANRDISFSIEKGEIVGLIGPNGAGKTTLFNCIAGYYRPEKGKILFMGEDITGKPPHETNIKGIARTFQVVESGGDMSVREEIMVGAFCRINSRREAERIADEIVDFLGLNGVKDKMVAELPVAMQKRVGLARAVATKPMLLLLDEVAAGLTSSEIDEMKRTLLGIKERWDLTIFLTEHVMKLVMELSHRVIVLDGGLKIAEGSPEEVSNNEDVIRAYLGERYAKGRTG